MKKLILPFLLLITFFSCQKDDEKDTDANIVGTWVCEENSKNLGTSFYSVYINPHSSISNRVVIDNFYNLGVTESHAQVEVNGNQLNLFLQNVHGFDVSGSGTLINDSQINMTFIADDGSGSDNVTATFTKTN
jgi:pSer/pThr/pTyr-binding forkhead associated (FHA) protein